MATYKTVQLSGGWTWQKLDEEDNVVYQSAKRCPSEEAATRLMSRQLDPKRDTSAANNVTDLPNCRRLQLPDGRKLTVQIHGRENEDGYRWTVLNNATTEGWQSELCPDTKSAANVSSGLFSSEKEAWVDVVQHVKHGALDDTQAAAHRNRRETATGRPGERMEVVVKPLQVPASANSTSTT